MHLLRHPPLAAFVAILAAATFTLTAAWTLGASKATPLTVDEAAVVRTAAARWEQLTVTYPAVTGDTVHEWSEDAKTVTGEGLHAAEAVFGMQHPVTVLWRSAANHVAVTPETLLTQTGSLAPVLAANASTIRGMLTPLADRPAPPTAATVGIKPPSAGDRPLLPTPMTVLPELPATLPAPSMPDPSYPIWSVPAAPATSAPTIPRR